MIPNTKEEFEKQYNALPEGVSEVVDALLDVFAIWKEHEEAITLSSLTDCFDLAIDDGYDMAEIQLAMVTMAIRESGKRRRSSMAGE